MSSDLNLAVGSITAGAAGAGAQPPQYPTNANDGNSLTYCIFHGGGAAGALPERWITSDLGTAYSVDRFTTLTTGNGADDLRNRLATASTPSPPNQYTRFQYSTDDVTYNDIAVTRISNDGNLPQLETYTFDGGAIEARYWRIYYAGKQSNNIWSGGNFYTWAIIGDPIVATVIAAFSGTPLTGNAPLTVVFTDLSSGTPDTWAWTFGDGETSTSQNPSHEYAATGTYTVTLTATRSSDASSDSETKTFYVTVSDRPMPGVWVDWENDGAFNSAAGGGDGRLARMLPQAGGGLDDEITADVHSFSWSYGGSADHVSSTNPGQATILVQNGDGKYNPDNSGSIYHGLLKPNRRVWAGLNADGTLTDSGLTVYGVFAGYIRQIVPLVKDGATALAEIICEDPLGAYSRRPSRVEASTGYSYNTLRAAVLADIGETRTSLAHEIETLPLAAVDSDNALSVLEEINTATGSRHWINPADTKEDWHAYTVVDRHYKLEASADAALNADDVQALSGYRVTEETIVNDQRVEVSQAQFDAGIDTVWTYAEASFPLTAKRTIWAEFDDFVKDATLDYTSTGGAVTTAFTNFGTTAKIELWSASTSVVANLSIEGRMVRRDAQEAVAAQDSTSQAIYGKRSGSSVASTYASTPALAQGLANFVVWKFKSPLTRPAITQVDEFAVMLARDLYDVITLTVDRLHVVARRYEIIGISGVITPGGSTPLVEITWELQEAPSQSALSLFTVGTDVLGGAAVLAR